MGLQDYMQSKPTLQTNRLTIRPLVPTDIDDLKEWLGEPSLYQYWGQRPSKSDRNPGLLFMDSKKKPSKSFHWGISNKQDGKLIGEIWVYLIENNRMAKMAFRLSPAYQGNGLMTEAVKEVLDFCFKNTELQRLWSDVHIDNVASYKTLEKVGFTREGLIRQGKMVSTYCDYYLYGLLKADNIKRGMI